MTKLSKYFAKSITRKFAALLITFFLLILIGAMFVLGNAYHTFQSYDKRLDELRDKRDLLADIERRTNQIFFYNRGYYLFLNPNELQEAELNMNRLYVSLQQLEAISSDEDDIDLIRRVSYFVENFQEHIAPQAADYAETGDYESLRQMAQSGVSISIHQLLVDLEEHYKDQRTIVQEENQRMMRYLFQQAAMLVGYIVILLVVAMFIVVRATRDVGIPLMQLSEKAVRFAQGESVELGSVKLNGEIGQLSHSLDYMIEQIQVKEEELLAQNEELQAQQDELLMQQEQLQEAIDIMTNNERSLQIMYEETERQRRITQDMLHTIHEGVQLIDLEGNIIQNNPKLNEILGLQGSQMRGIVGIEQFFEHMSRKVVDPERFVSYVRSILWRQLAADKGNAQSYMIEILESKPRYVKMYAEVLLHNDKDLGTLFVYRDVTTEYEVDQMKSEFVSTVSHELRTPLAGVLGFTELLLTRELKPERTRRYLETIHQEAQRLTALINDFLDVQRMESGRQTYVLEPVLMREVVEEVVAMNRENSPHTFQIVMQSEQQLVWGDKSKIHQVLMNLIGNAVKYSPAGGDITINGRQDGRYFMLDVQDRGLGIPAEAIPHLFTKFYRVDNTDRREIGGTGLGLSIVREIILKHGGEVTVVSMLGRGSTFTVSIPLYATSD